MKSRLAMAQEITVVVVMSLVTRGSSCPSFTSAQQSIFQTILSLAPVCLGPGVVFQHGEGLGTHQFPFLVQIGEGGSHKIAFPQGCLPLRRDVVHPVGEGHLVSWTQWFVVFLFGSGDDYLIEAGLIQPVYSLVQRT